MAQPKDAVELLLERVEMANGYENMFVDPDDVKRLAEIVRAMLDALKNTGDVDFAMYQANLIARGGSSDSNT